MECKNRMVVFYMIYFHMRLLYLICKYVTESSMAVLNTWRLDECYFNPSYSRSMVAEGSVLATTNNNNKKSLVREPEPSAQQVLGWLWYNVHICTPAFQSGERYMQKWWRPDYPHWKGSSGEQCVCLVRTKLRLDVRFDYWKHRILHIIFLVRYLKL